MDQDAEGAGMVAPTPSNHTHRAPASEPIGRNDSSASGITRPDQALPEVPVAEAFAAEPLSKEDFTELRKAGVSPMHIGKLGQTAPVGMVYAEPEAGGTYRPAIAGKRCLQFGVMADDTVYPSTTNGSFPVGISRIVDLVAFPVKRPERFRTRYGRGFALGMDLVLAGKPVTVVETPLEWLAADGDAICILDWSPRPAFKLLAEALELLPTTRFLENMLRTSIARQGSNIAKAITDA